MQPPVLVAMAVYIGKTRLIDNFIYEGRGYKNGLNRRVQTVLRCRQSRPLSRNQDFDLLKQKNKQMRSGGGKHLETPCFPRGGKAPSADSIPENTYRPRRGGRQSLLCGAK